MLMAERLPREKCDRCLGLDGTFMAQLTHAEEFAIRNETDRALARLRWASDIKSIMDGEGCLWEPESKLVDSTIKDLSDAIARKETHKVVGLASDVAFHLVKALRERVCR